MSRFTAYRVLSSAAHLKPRACCLACPFSNPANEAPTVYIGFTFPYSSPRLRSHTFTAEKVHPGKPHDSSTFDNEELHHPRTRSGPCAGGKLVMGERLNDAHPPNA